ncbi:MAG: endonuclease III domain-containing protein [Candidatus Polarisedimenticolaceae bacterium]|nr:endonuclease III domain-containing protein [Candidatus Polarisedimenticolaceae bacterium]
MKSDDLRWIFEQLFNRYGPQHWWPAETPFEVMVGAVLTQNTAWLNVERAINNLKQADSLSCQQVVDLPPAELAELIRPAGYLNLKAKRLQNLCRFLLESGGESTLSSYKTDELRQALLSVNGVGPETADDILLYAFQRPVFVIDAYTRRILTAYGLIAGDESYEVLRSGFEAGLPLDSALFNEYHALIVKHAKNHCRKKPQCAGCSLIERCQQGRANEAEEPTAT